MIIVLVGPPGSGKGTQSEMLMADYSAEHISVGDILREEVKKESELGLKIKDIIEKGDLLGDNDVFDVVKQRLEHPLDVQFIILDGYPRTIEQAKLLDTFYKKPIKVVYLKLDIKKLQDRFENRYYCAQCGKIYNEKTNMPRVQGICDDCGSSKFEKRKDDTQEVFEQRMKNYEEKTSPLIDFYLKSGVLYNIDASKDRYEVHEEIVKIIQEL